MLDAILGILCMCICMPVFLLDFWATPGYTQSLILTLGTDNFWSEYSMSGIYHGHNGLGWISGTT